MSIEITSLVWGSSTLKGSERLVLVCLAHHANKAGECWPSIKTLSLETGISLTTVKKALKHLEAEQWIVKTNRFSDSEKGKRKTSNFYKVSIAQLVGDQRCKGEKNSESESDLSLGQNPAKGRAGGGHKPSIESSKERSISALRDVQGISRFDNAFERFWNAGLIKRNKKKARQAFQQLVVTDALVGESLDVFVQQLVADVQRRIARQQFGIDKLHPATYLNQERWNDEDETYGATSHHQASHNAKQYNAREEFILGQLREYGPELVLQAGIASEVDVRHLWPQVASQREPAGIVVDGVAEVLN
ncbi:helix-turn-helix domain-containing protein [Vibrio alfacsensis]|uniref:helix-turn-helix domain-containing protein n=1 Tax=Vibrio alfacsensis TaxID=1074311 RepID=UPI0040695F2F